MDSDLFGVQDQNVYRKIKDSLENYPCENIFVGSTVSFECDIKDSYKEFPMHTRYHLFEGDYLHKNFAKFSDDCYAVVYDGFTITYSLIQLAIYFGFKEIYLLGADCNYEVGNLNILLSMEVMTKILLLRKKECL